MDAKQEQITNDDKKEVESLDSVTSSLNDLKIAPNESDSSSNSLLASVLEDSWQSIEKENHDGNWKFDYEHYLCPITYDFMNDPVCTPYGHTFERIALEEWINKHGTCPLTNKPLKITELYPCFALKSAIRDLLDKNPHLKFLPATMKTPTPINFTEKVQNKGSIKFERRCKQFGLVERSGAEMRQRYKSIQYFSDESTFIKFPPPDAFFIFMATGSICLRNTGDKPIVLFSIRIEDGKNVIEGRSYTLEPKKSKGFDIRGFGWSIEVREGDAACLNVYDFATSGGGKGNDLGMYLAD